MRPEGGAALAPLRTFRGATVRERTREARRSQWPSPLASRATKQTAREGAPDSDSRSVEREGAQAAARNIVKRGAHAAAPAPQASLTVSRQPPDSDSRSVVREGAQAAARNIVKWGAHAAAPAPQASLTVSRQPSLWVAVKCGVCFVALLGFVVQTTTFVARLAAIRILPATRLTKDLIRGSLGKDKNENKTSGGCSFS